VSATDHDRWEDELAAYLLDALETGEAAAFEAHLATCDRCRADLRWLAPAIGVLPASVEQIDPPAELRGRILGAIEAEQPSLAGGERQPQRRGERQPWWQRLAGRPALAGVAAAVALAIGVAGGYALGGGSDDPRVVTRIVPVQATTSTTAASGQLVNHDGTWTLDVSKLPQPRDGDVYQVWMRDGEQLLPSVLFVPSRDGTAKIVLPDETGSVDEMLVTREPSGGSAQPTSDPLAAATLQ
jgi:anti-sigma-K factor RskA